MVRQLLIQRNASLGISCNKYNTIKKIAFTFIFIWFNDLYVKSVKDSMRSLIEEIYNELQLSQLCLIFLAV